MTLARNTYRVYEDGGKYLVVGESSRGRRYEHRIHPEAVSYLCSKLKGRSVNAAQAGEAIEPVAERFRLPYTYGDMLKWSGQSVLVSAVALGQATVSKNGRSFFYSIK